MHMNRNKTCLANICKNIHGYLIVSVSVILSVYIKMLII